MTLEQLAGQLLWCGWGPCADSDPCHHNDHSRFLIEEMQVGGIILFARNLRAPAEVADLTAALRRGAPLPPLMGIDQEGGRVLRLDLPGLRFPGNMALGVLDRPEVTRAVCRAIGEQLAALGIDVDFAPVVDVNNNPRNPVIGIRSFGEDPQLVARHGVASVAGFRDAGVLPVLKHFPGHGDTGADSHFELPVLTVDRRRLDAVELVPFRAAIAAGAPAVMSTHILFPALDPDLPATLSRRVLTGLLREELGFDGLVTTDCLEMQGITNHWGPEEAAVLALEAGADVLVVCHTREVQERMWRSVCAAVRAGRLTEERLWESVRRVQRVRELTEGVRNSPPAPARVGAQRYLDLEAEAAAEAVRFFPGADEARLDGWTRAEPVVVAGPQEPVVRLAAALRDEGFTVEALPWQNGTRDRVQAALAPNGAGTQFVWAVLPQEPFRGGCPPPEFVDRLTANRRTLVVPVREHYCIENYPETLPWLTAWGAQTPHMQALARWLRRRTEAGSEP